MRRCAAWLALVCVPLVACDQDPARAIKIIARPAPKAEPAAPPTSAPAPPKPVPSPGPTARPASSPAPAATPAAAPPAPVYEFQWRPNLCPPPPEPSPGPSTLVVTGACAFRHQGATNCSATADDFYVEATRPGARDSTVLIYANVERYKGPGRYDKAEMLIGVNDPGYNYRWFSDGVHITVAEDETFVEIQPVRLEPLPPVEAPDLEVGGKLVCRPGASNPSGAGG
jgi:hypothetical protein